MFGTTPRYCCLGKHNKPSSFSSLLLGRGFIFFERSRAGKVRLPPARTQRLSPISLRAPLSRPFLGAAYGGGSHLLLGESQSLAIRVSAVFFWPHRPLVRRPVLSGHLGALCFCRLPGGRTGTERRSPACDGGSLPRAACCPPTEAPWGQSELRTACLSSGGIGRRLEPD